MKRNLLIGVLSVALLLVLSGVAFAQFGSISGRVTDDSTGLPIMGAHVWAKADTTQPGGFGFDITDSSGFYVIDNLYAGAFLAFASAQGFEEETYPESVIVIAGENRPDIDFALTPTGSPEYGSISGWVTDQVTGLPLMGAHLVATGVDTYCFGEAWSDSNGYYMIEDLCVGIWQVQASKTGYYTQIYPDSVSVVEGQNTPDIDFSLTPAGSPELGSISGRVTDEVSGYPIQGATITLSGIYGSWYTDSTGHYMCDSIPVGGYWVTAYATGYHQETYPESVIVFEGQNTSDIDFALTPTGSPESGSITGWVGDEETGLPIIMARIRAFGLDDTCYGEAWSDTGGQYGILDLCPGNYQVIASKEGYAPETYPDSVTVVAGQNTPNIDFTLAPMTEYGSISGRVTDEESGLPISMAHLVATGMDNWCFAETWSDTNGYYTFTHMCPGIYQIDARAQGYIPETYPDSVMVVAGEDTPGIDFTLTPIGGMGSISGVVTDDSTGIPLPMAHVVAYDSTHYAGDAWTDTAGLYLMQNLAAGQYIVGVHKDGYEDEIYPESVIVEEGQNTPHIDFALAAVGGPECGSISGRVTDEETGLPIVFAEITITGTYSIWYSDTSGFYFCDSLPPGSYVVNAQKDGYGPETYPDSVIVMAGENAPNVDFALAPIHLGDADGNGEINISDPVYLINYLFKDGSAPVPLQTGNVNCDEAVSISDVVYLINYIIRNGPAPACLPTGTLVDFTDCKSLMEVSFADTTPPYQDCIEYQYDGENVLLLKHVNAGFNCCPGEITADITVDGNAITIEENESLEGGGCNCLCLFDLDLKVANLEPGEYTISVLGLYLYPEDELLEFTVSLSSSPSSGSYCVNRDHYPWRGLE